ncbi:hypothetical protein EZV62_006746 [Acer yangbiense]|uniref:Protein kinase domain-containing protein n=1 Tax=Acer yangbiense TaxID=1000413 RepID=A0A5C7I8H5_9ROSI|nr:hypothetical protein EZV62_006746 [Acer yangbiense]
MEIANTFAYLHVGFPRSIVYAYISALKFLLDEHYVPKLVDFSYAECIQEGQTQIKDAQVRGFIGFMAPEQFNGVLNESCDVYGFGALLFEVLTGQWIHNLVRSNEMKDEDFKSSSEIKDNEDRELSYKTREKYWLCNFVKKINEDNRFIEVVDPMIAEDVLCPEIEHQVKVFAQLAVKCQSFSAEDRPTMIDVAKQLRQLYLSTSAYKILVSCKTEDEDLQYSSGTEDEDSGTQYHDLLQNFVKKINEDTRLIEAVDPIIIGDGQCPEIEQQLKVCMELAVKCLSYSGEDRPTMIDAAKQLRQLYLSTS